MKNTILTKVMALATVGIVLIFSGLSATMAQTSTNLKALERSPNAERRVALVVGNAAYYNQPLKNPVNDARAMSHTLADLGFEVLTVENATRRDIQKAILKFSERLADGGVGLFYYAGHGIEVRGTNYLVPTDENITSEASVRFEAVSLDAVLEQMGQPRPNRMNIVILDACRNNPYASRFGGSGSGLALVDAPVDFLIAYATAPGRIAADGEGSNGLYTQEILKAIRSPKLQIEDVFKRVRSAVSKATRHAQTPWEASSLTSDFSFVQSEPKPTRVAEVIENASAPRQLSASRGVSAAGSNPALELEFWNSIKSSGSSEDYAAYLEAFPTGAFTPLARLRIRQAERENQSQQSAAKQAQDAARKDADAKQAAANEAAVKAAAARVASEKAAAAAAAAKKDQAAKAAAKKAAAARAATAKDAAKKAAAAKAADAKVAATKAAAKRAAAAKAAAAKASAKRTAALKVAKAKAAAEDKAAAEEAAAASAAKAARAVKAAQAAKAAKAAQAAKTAKAATKPKQTVVASLPPSNSPAVPAGASFKDCPQCPAMVSLPAGYVLMGGQETKDAAAINIRKPFAIGQHEVTYGNWKQCKKEGGCSYSPTLKNSSDLSPVRNVSWTDTQEYVKWLRKKTGNAYRLPTESEWEYAARGGSLTRYPWGDKFAKNAADCKDCGPTYNRKKPADIGSFPANNFGLHNMVGGVWEWVEDCWNTSLKGVPSNGEARHENECLRRTLRGGSWKSNPDGITLATRFHYDYSVRYYTNGFRVALSVK